VTHFCCLLLSHQVPKTITVKPQNYHHHRRQVVHWCQVSILVSLFVGLWAHNQVPITTLGYIPGEFRIYQPSMEFCQKCSKKWVNGIQSKGVWHTSVSAHKRSSDVWCACLLIPTNGNFEITFSESTLAAAAVLRRKEKLIIKVRLEQVFLPGAKLFFHPLLLLFRVSKKKISDHQFAVPMNWIIFELCSFLYR